MDTSIPLATVTSLDEICCVLLHCGPKIARPHDLLDEGLCPHVIVVNSHVHFFENVFGLFLFYTPQVRLGEASFVKLVIQHRESGSSFLDLLGLLRIRW